MAASQNHRSVHGVLAITLILGYCATSQGVEFAGGTGEPNDPYQIATAEQLVAISSDPSLFDEHFILTADIDLDPSLPGRQVFRQAVVDWSVSSTVPARRAVGIQDISTAASSAASLHGSFDGAGHIIRNCVLAKAGSTWYAGFFGEIAPSGVVRNLHIEDMLIADLGNGFGGHPGLLAAINQGTVVGCSATGTLSTYTGGGGLVGQNAGLMVGCRASCDIFGSSVGGLVGRNDAAGRVLLCEFDGVLFGNSLAGGLVGTNLGTIQYCKSDGFVSAGQAGGMVGQNTGLVRECCVTGTVESGGGVAYNNGGTIVNCYTTTGIILGTFANGLAIVNSGTILSSYSTTASLVRTTSTPPRRSPGSGDAGAEESAERSEPGISILAERLVRYVYHLDSSKMEDSTGDPYSGYGVALSPAQMTQRSSFVGFDFYGDANDGPTDHWFMPPEGYPVLTWQTEITGLIGVPDVSGLSLEQAQAVLEFAGLEFGGVRYDYAKPPEPRTETKGQVIVTHSVGYLSPGNSVELVVSLGKYNFRENVGDGSEERPYQIETAGQLDALCGETALWGKHFDLTADIDLTGHVYSGPLIEILAGEFNGNGHAIRNLRSDFGLFGAVESGACVRDLIVDRAYLSQVTAPATGILAGLNRGQILRCQAAGQISGGRSEVGGLVGYNYGQLMDCSFSGRIRPIDDGTGIGGLAGRNIGSISRCCARDVDISAGGYVGGLVGINHPGALVEACYATGSVQGVSSVGGLVGQHGTSLRPTRRSVLTQDQIAIAADPLMGPVIRNCYAACSVTGQGDVGGCIGSMSESNAAMESCFFLAPVDGGGPDNGLGTSLTDVQMKQQVSFAGWDFMDTWTICEGVDYPRLRWEVVNCEVGP